MRCSTLGLVALALLALLAQSAETPPQSLDVRVVDAATRDPVRAAIVLASGLSSDTSTSRDAPFLTDVEGRCAVQSGTAPLGLLVTKTGYLDARVVSASTGRVGALVIPVTPVASIVGRVLDPAGNPVPGATVGADIKGETLDGRPRMTTTDDRGQYVIDGLTAGEYVVAAGRTRDDAMTRPHPYPAATLVEMGEERDGVDLHVPWDQGAEAARLLKAMGWQRGTARGTASIAGSVRNALGRGVATVIVTAWPADTPPGVGPMWSAVTDERGAFAIENLPPGSFSLVAHRRTVGPGAGTTAVSVPGIPVRLAPGQRRADVDITVRELASIAGVVRDEFGDPVRATSDSSRWTTPCAWAPLRPGQPTTAGGTGLRISGDVNTW